MSNVSVSTYGDYQSKNYGANAVRVTVGEIEFYFSYQTVVAFYSPKTGLLVHRNDWSTTTGKHLNAIDGGRKVDRLNHADFQTALAGVLADYGLTVPSAG